MKFTLSICFYQPTGGMWTIERDDHYLGWPVHSMAFVCPFCLSNWAKLTQQGAPGVITFQIQSAACEKCSIPGHWILNPIPGSILDNHSFSSGPDFDLLESLPQELLVREFNLHIKQFERQIDELLSNLDTYPLGKPAVATAGG